MFFRVQGQKKSFRLFAVAQRARRRRAVLVLLVVHLLQRRPALSVGQTRVRTSGEQRVHSLRRVLPRRVVQRRAPVGGARVGIGAVVEELAHDRRLVRGGGPVQSGGVVPPALGSARAVAQQVAHAREVAARDGSLDDLPGADHGGGGCHLRRMRTKKMARPNGRAAFVRRPPRLLGESRRARGDASPRAPSPRG